MHDRQPTQLAFNTTTARFFRWGAHSVSGSSASNGQCVMHRSHPVQSGSMISTIAWPIVQGEQVAPLDGGYGKGLRTG
jgi:hypothetical protein